MIENIIDVSEIIFLFAVFGFLHSYLASNKVKLFLLKRFGNLIAFYRFIYVVISLIAAYIVYLFLPGSYTVVYDLPRPFGLIVLVPQFLALAGAVWTLKYFSLGEFIGINQIIRWLNKDYDTGNLDEELTFRIGGMYKRCRHPVYFFSIMFLLFRAEMSLTYFTLFVCISVYFYVGSYYEEKKLVKKFGEKYILYQKSVPRIFPFKMKVYKKDYLTNILKL